MIGSPNAVHYQGGGTNYLVQANSGDLYLVFIESTSVDVYFKKSSDGGLSWTSPTSIYAGSATALAVWYDRWSDIAAGLIHCAYIESGTDDIRYRTINTESSDALSTETVVFDGASTATGGWLSITRARGGNVYCYGVIDAGVEGGFFRLPNANVPNGAWDAARSNPEALATTDQAILVPGFAADNQDIMCIFWDASADEISRYVHDDSANTWAETSIATSMTDVAATSSWAHFAAAVDIANSRIVVAAWSAVDTANADLRCWTVTESAITETSTNVVLNSTDDQGFAAVAIDTDTGDWYVAYGGKSDGSETWLATLNVYYKVSTDDGATWSAETVMTGTATARRMLMCSPRFTGPFKCASLVNIGTIAIELKLSLPVYPTVAPTLALGVI